MLQQGQPMVAPQYQQQVLPNFQQPVGTTGMVPRVPVMPIVPGGNMPQQMQMQQIPMGIPSGQQIPVGIAPVQQLPIGVSPAQQIPIGIAPGQIPQMAVSQQPLVQLGQVIDPSQVGNLYFCTDIFCVFLFC